MAAAAAFLERAATLTPQPARRAQRLLAAARAKRDAGALDAALALLVAVEARPLDAIRTAEVEHLRGQIAFDQRRIPDAARLLLSAARRLEPLNPDSARETHLEAIGAALWANDTDSPRRLLEAAAAARAAPPSREPPRVADVLLDAFAVRLTEGYAAAAPPLTRALERFLALDADTDESGRWLSLTGGRAGAIIAVELWDAESWHALVDHQVQFARATGALVHLQLALNLLGAAELAAGELSTALELFEEDRVIAEATGNAPLSLNKPMLAAWRGVPAPGSELIDATTAEPAVRGFGAIAELYARAVLCNGLGRHEAARDAALRAFARDPVGFGPFVAPELAEAASRTGDVERVRAVLAWLSERTRVTPTEWALGIEARVRALLGDGDAADRLYRESIAHLGRTRLRVQVARAHLLYGEWLRRQRRRIDARAHLGIAHEMLDTMGVGAFAERARRELSATGETARKRTADTRDELTAQEALIARLARRGAVQPRDRDATVHQPPHRQVPPAQGLHQVGHQLARRARARLVARRPRLAAPTRPHCPLADAPAPPARITLARMLWSNTPIQPRFRTIDGLTVRFAESERRDDHALFAKSSGRRACSPSSRSGRGSPNTSTWWRSICLGSASSERRDALLSPGQSASS